MGFLSYNNSKFKRDRNSFKALLVFKNYILWISDCFYSAYINIQPSRQSKKVTNFKLNFKLNFTPPLPPKYSMLKHFDVIQKLVPSKDHFNNKKHYKCKTAILKQKNHHFLNFPKPVSETGCHGNMINHMDMVIIPKCS